MIWVRVKHIPVAVVIPLMLVSALIPMLIFQPWNGGSEEEPLTLQEVRSEDRAVFLQAFGETPAPAFTLTDQNGEQVSLEDLRGKWLVVDWIYTNCMTVCPALTATMKILENSLDGKVGNDVQFVSITFDPGRDSVDVLKSYSQKVGADVLGWS